MKVGEGFEQDCEEWRKNRAIHCYRLHNVLIRTLCCRKGFGSKSFSVWPWHSSQYSTEFHMKTQKINTDLLEKLCITCDTQNQLWEYVKLAYKGNFHFTLLLNHEAKHMTQKVNSYINSWPEGLWIISTIWLMQRSKAVSFWCYI